MFAFLASVSAVRLMWICICINRPCVRIIKAAKRLRVYIRQLFPLPSKRCCETLSNHEREIRRNATGFKTQKLILTAVKFTLNERGKTPMNLQLSFGLIKL